MQQTLVEAFEGQDQFRGSGDAQRAAWLRQILARNLANAARDHRRQKRNIERERSLEASMGDSSVKLGNWLAADESSPSQRAAREEEVFRLSRVLSRLPEEHFRVVTLRHLRGKSLQEIGEELNLSRYLVARRMREAMDQLRRNLE